jgi:hypothetical protein
MPLRPATETGTVAAFLPPKSPANVTARRSLKSPPGSGSPAASPDVPVPAMRPPMQCGGAGPGRLPGLPFRVRPPGRSSPAGTRSGKPVRRYQRYPGRAAQSPGPRSITHCGTHWLVMPVMRRMVPGPGRYPNIAQLAQGAAEFSTAQLRPLSIGRNLHAMLGGQHVAFGAFPRDAGGGRHPALLDGYGRHLRAQHAGLRISPSVSRSPTKIPDYLPFISPLRWPAQLPQGAEMVPVSWKLNVP